MSMVYVNEIIGELEGRIGRVPPVEQDIIVEMCNEFLSGVPEYVATIEQRLRRNYENCLRNPNNDCLVRLGIISSVVCKHCMRYLAFKNPAVIIQAEMGEVDFYNPFREE